MSPEESYVRALPDRRLAALVCELEKWFDGKIEPRPECAAMEAHFAGLGDRHRSSAMVGIMALREGLRRARLLLACHRCGADLGVVTECVNFCPACHEALAAPETPSQPS